VTGLARAKRTGIKKEARSASLLCMCLSPSLRIAGAKRRQSLPLRQLRGQCGPR
jgi:hypothetical protein